MEMRHGYGKHLWQDKAAEKTSVAVRGADTGGSGCSPPPRLAQPSQAELLERKLNSSSWKKMQLFGGHFTEQQPGDIGAIWKAQKDLDTTTEMWP